MAEEGLMCEEGKGFSRSPLILNIQNARKIIIKSSHDFAT